MPTREGWIAVAPGVWLVPVQPTGVSGDSRSVLLIAGQPYIVVTEMADAGRDAPPVQATP